jgi:hypothetical protein
VAIYGYFTEGEAVALNYTQTQRAVADRGCRCWRRASASAPCCGPKPR